MERREYKQTAQNLIYLVKCCLDGRTPNDDIIREIDLSQLYLVAQDHSLVSMVACTLESAGIKDESFNEAKLKASRKAIYFQIERNAVLSELEKANIWYSPLKGIIIQNLYPKKYMREMADNDILFDNSHVKEPEQYAEISTVKVYTNVNNISTSRKVRYHWTFRDFCVTILTLLRGLREC